MTSTQLLSQELTSIEFTDVMAVISAEYDYSPTAFSNGDLRSEGGTNEGSCKIFYFAKLNELSEQTTLALFGQYYRVDVLQNPEGVDHGNIRNFMKSGWKGVTFDAVALVKK
jgi:hypothetical protein